MHIFIEWVLESIADFYTSGWHKGNRAFILIACLTFLVLLALFALLVYALASL